MPATKTLSLSFLLVIGLVFGACGDDDSSSNDVVSEGDKVQDDAEDAAENAAENVIGAQVGGECAFLGQMAGGSLDDLVDPTQLFGPGGSNDLGAVFAPLAEEFGDVAAAAPSEIKDDFVLLADAFAEMADGLEGVVIDFTDPENIDPEVLAKLESLGSTFEDASFEEASDNIEAWIEENCEPLGS